MAIRFIANGGRASGYRASYKFFNGIHFTHQNVNKSNIILVLSIESADLIEVPITDCGGLVDDHGGVITMHNMSSPNAARLYVSFLFTNSNNIQSI